MHYGIHLFPTIHSIQPGKLASCVEERGFESVWFSEHTHIPVKFLNSGEDGPALADYYWQLYDPFVAVTLACSVTKTIKIGTAVSLVIEHHPITLAKQVATIDHISGGRFLFGIGSGWIPEELKNHGVIFRTRYRLDIIAYIKPVKIGLVDMIRMQHCETFFTAEIASAHKTKPSCHQTVGI